MTDEEGCGRLMIEVDVDPERWLDEMKPERWPERVDQERWLDEMDPERWLDEMDPERWPEEWIQRGNLEVRVEVSTTWQ
jgi:hypothetical protein